MNNASKRSWTEFTKLAVSPILVYFLVFCVLTYPLILRFPTHFFTDGGDGLQNVWNLWWVNKAVTQLHQSPWFTRYLHYPQGTSLIGQTLNPFNGFLAIPLLRFFSLTVTHNLIVIFSFVAAGMTAFWLSYFLTKSYWSSLAAGYFFTFSQYHFSHAEGHLQLVSMEWIPLFVLCWIRLVQKPSLPKAAAAGLVLFAVLLCDYYYFFYCVLAGVLIALWYILSKKDLRSLLRREYLLGFGGFLAISLLTSGVLVIALLRISAQDPLSGAHDPLDFSLDLLATLIPGGHWRFAQLTEPYWSRLPGEIHESSVYLGASVIFLVAYSLLARRETRSRFPSFWLWFALLAFFGALALGPALQIFGKRIYSGPMPYTLLQAVFPQLKLSGVPVRMIVMVILSAAVLSAMGLSILFEKFSSQRVVLLPILGFFLVFDFLPRPLPATKLDAPEYVTLLKSLPADGGVLDRAASETIALYYQTIHEKPLIEGYISRSPKSVAAEANRKARAFEQQDYLTLFKAYQVRYIAAAEPLGASACQTRLNLLSDRPEVRLYAIQIAIGAVEELAPASLNPTAGILGEIDQYNGDKITGWAVIPDLDASASEISILLANEARTWKIPVCRKNRVDVSKSFNNGKLYDQSGYLAYIDDYPLPPGTYRVGVLVENGNQRAIQFSERRFVASE